MTRRGRAEDQEELRKKKKRTGKRKRTSDLAAKACKAMQSHFFLNVLIILNLIRCQKR